MNNARRKKLKDVVSVLEKAKCDVESVLNDEQDAFDNLPDGLQGTERADAMDNACDELDSALDYIDDAISAINNAI